MIEEWKSIAGYEGVYEFWNSIPNYEGFYEASTLGRIRNIKLGHILKPKKRLNGYLEVDLCKSGSESFRLVHRLIAESFLGSVDGEDVHHKDGNKENNHVSNLIICEAKDHCPKRGFNLHNAHLTEDDVRDIRKKYAIGISQRKLAPAYNISQAAVSLIITGHTWKHIN